MTRRQRFRAWVASAASSVAGWLRSHWLAVLSLPVLAVFGYVFYLSLALRLPVVLVMFGSLGCFIVGMGAFFGMPFVVGKSAPWKLRYAVFRLYNWFTQQALGRGHIVKREHAGVELCAAVYDSDRGSEHIKLDGDWRDFEDVADRMQYLKSGGAFGIIDEDSTLIFDPVDAAIGARRREIVEASQEVIEVGSTFGEVVREHCKLPETSPVVDLRAATRLLGGNADPTDAAATEEFEQKAWTDHQNVPVVDAMVMAGLLSATLFVIWLAFSFADSGGSGGGGGSGIVSGALLLWPWRWER